MSDYPILYTIRHIVKGPSFEAVVTASGRTLITHEDEEWWCLGVEPGGIAEPGEGPSSAFDRFSASFRHGLEDIAEISDTLEAFETDACALFRTDDADAARWDAALHRIKGGEVPELFSKLPRKIWTGVSEIDVQPLERNEPAPMDAVVQENLALPTAA